MNKMAADYRRVGNVVGYIGALTTAHVRARYRYEAAWGVAHHERPVRRTSRTGRHVNSRRFLRATSASMSSSAIDAKQVDGGEIVRDCIVTLLLMVAAVAAPQSPECYGANLAGADLPWNPSIRRRPEPRKPNLVSANLPPPIYAALI